MAGGQAITTALGTIIAVGGGPSVALAGSASTLAVGTPVTTDFVPLRSKKVGGGTATALLTGHQSVLAQGVVFGTKGAVLLGLGLTGQQGILLYRGQVTLNWNANTEPDVVGYRLLHGDTTPGVYNGADTVDLGLVTSYVMGGLLPGRTHYWVIQARDAANQFSGNSAEVSKTFGVVSPGGFVEAQGT